MITIGNVLWMSSSFFVLGFAVGFSTAVRRNALWLRAMMRWARTTGRFEGFIEAREGCACLRPPAAAPAAGVGDRLDPGQGEP